MIARVDLRHRASRESVRTALDALQSSGGTMAQFSHSEFGGMSQLSRGGMTMVGDMFNTDMKAKLDAICTDLAAYLTEAAPSEEPSKHRKENVSYRANSASRSSWWPDDLRAASSVGSQNNMRYAVFPLSRRAQSTDQTLTFTSQDGLVRVTDLRKIAGYFVAAAFQSKTVKLPDPKWMPSD